MRLYLLHIKSRLCLNLKQRCKIVSDSNRGHFCWENIIQILLFASKHKEFANLETNQVACGEILRADAFVLTLTASSFPPI